MSPFELTTGVNTLANILACQLSNDDLTLASALFTQLGDTLATISAMRQRCDSTPVPPSTTSS